MKTKIKFQANTVFQKYVPTLQDRNMGQANRMPNGGNVWKKAYGMIDDPIDTKIRENEHKSMLLSYKKHWNDVHLKRTEKARLENDKLFWKILP